MLVRIIFIAALALSIILPSLAEACAITGNASVTVFEPSVLDSSAGNVGKVVVGQQVTVSVTIRNNLDIKWPITEIIEIRDSGDITVYLALQSISIQPAGNYTFGSSWMPGYADTYHVRTFAITELENPQILSAVKTHDVLVFENESQTSVTFNDPGIDQSFLMFNDTILENYSVNPQIELQYYFDELTRTLNISAYNSGTNDTEMDVDGWQVARSYGGGEQGENFVLPESERRIIVPAGNGVLLKSISLGNVASGHDFEIFPPTYGVDFVGYKGNIEDKSNRQDYRLKLEIVVEYDKAALKELGINKLLLANNIMLVINGTFADGQPFVIDDDSPKRIDIYITNNEAGKISAMRTGDSFGIWPLSNRNLEESSGGVADFFGTECYYLKPGESVRATSIMLSKTEWPLGGKFGIELSHKELPGLYVLYYSAYTRPCTLEDEERIPATNPTLIAVFEVK
jgi:hypothetical protein